MSRAAELLRHWPLALAVLLTGAVHFGLHQLDRQVRFEIGEAGDPHYLVDAGGFQPPTRMSGPRRRPDGDVVVEDFLGRLTTPRVTLRLPYHLWGSPVRLNLRCHRFGLGGTVSLSVNGRLLGDHSFSGSPYPWAGIQAIVPAELARRGPLVIELWTTGGEAPPEHLPADLGVGLDWIEVAADSRGGVLLPSVESWLRLVLLLLAWGVALAIFRVHPQRRAALLLAGGLAAGVGGQLGGRTDGLLYQELALGVTLAASAALGFRVLHAWRPDAALRAATLLLASGFAFAVVESFARLREAQILDERSDAHEPLRILVPNPNGTGSYRLRPDVEVRTRVGYQDVVIRTNGHGMHWREVSRAADPARPRIAFLGDSFTFGCWASDVERSFVGVAESQLGRERFEALNFGVGGYGLADSELLLRELAIDFSPRYVILVIFNGNDLRDTYLGLEKDRIVDGVALLDEELLAAKVPQGFLQEDQTTSGPSPEEGWVAGLRALASFRLLAPLLRMEHLQIDFAPNVRFVSYSFWSRIPYHPVALAARDATLAAIGRIRDFTRERGIGLGVVTLPTRDQVYAHRAFGRDFDIGLPQAWVQTFCRESRIPYLDLLPVLRDHVLRTNQRVYVPGDTHLDDAGHRIAGEAIGEWIDCCVAREARRTLRTPIPPSLASRRSAQN